VAAADAEQAALVGGVEVVPIDGVSRLRELAEGSLEPVGAARRLPLERPEDELDLADLKGQPALRRALEISAAGGHSLLLIGPPGGGKTLAARRLPSLLPPLAEPELLEVLRIAGACANGTRPSPRRPFRAPHHTASAWALIGGASPPRPGEVTRAHRGVLFLDELGEFRRDALEALRQPLEEGEITLSRLGRTVTLPSRFILVAASNPCPCGRGVDSGECDCHPSAVARYRAKLSGALADRIDLRVTVDRPGADELAAEPGESSAEIRARVAAAREQQERRLDPGRCNGELGPEELRRHCPLSAEAEAALRNGHEQLGLSGRGWDRVLRVSRTIADLRGVETIAEGDVFEAISLRRTPEA